MAVFDKVAPKAMAVFDSYPCPAETSKLTFPHPLLSPLLWNITSVLSLLSFGQLLHRSDWRETSLQLSFVGRVMPLPFLALPFLVSSVSMFSS